MKHLLPLDRAMDDAIRWLAQKLPPGSELPKPVLLHSIRVSFELRARGHDRDVCLAGLLHDVLEDADVTPEELEQEFGSEVLHLVQANTKDETLSDWDERYEDMLTRCVELGQEATIIKAADLLDNMEYFKRMNRPEKVEKFLRIIRMLLDRLPATFTDPIFEDLRILVS